MSDLHFLTASELGPLFQAKQLSPVELTEELLSRIERFDPTLQTYITPLYDVAMSQAKEAENKILNNEYLGPLHGIPVGIKDNKYTRGIRTTDGSKLFAEFYPGESATVVNKLEQAGVIMLGKQNMHELASGSTGTNPYFGTTRNPWDIESMPGGSSSGAAASLAAGLATLATGSDTFGSIRQPAAMNGVYGLKPTYGLVSTHGMFPAAWTLDTAGPMARSVKDLAIMLEAMAGYDPKDPASLKVPILDYSKELDVDIRGLIIGIPTYYLRGLDEDVATLFQQAIQKLEELGVRMVEVNIPELEMSTFSGVAIVGSEAATFHHKWLKTHETYYSPDVRSIYLAGSLTKANLYIKAQQARRRLIKAMDKAFKQVDMMLGPVVPYVTPKFEDNWVTQNIEIVEKTMPFTVPVNLAGLPALAVPMGRDRRDMPVGMQFIGNHLQELPLLQVGAVWEQLTPLQFTVAR